MCILQCHVTSKTYKLKKKRMINMHINGNIQTFMNSIHSFIMMFTTLHGVNWVVKVVGRVS